MRMADIDETCLYAREKLGVAVWKLATGEGEIKSRLADAALELTVLQSGDLPADLEEDWLQIRADLTSGKMQYVRAVRDGALVKEQIGLVKSTLRYMRKDKAVDIAKRICTLEAQLQERSETILCGSNDGELG